jgi:hypothetical protein
MKLDICIVLSPDELLVHDGEDGVDGLPFDKVVLDDDVHEPVSQETNSSSIRRRRWHIVTCILTQSAAASRVV